MSKAGMIKYTVKIVLIKHIHITTILLVTKTITD